MRSGNIVMYVDVQSADGATGRWTWPDLQTWAKSSIGDYESRQNWLREAGTAYLAEDGAALARLLEELSSMEEAS